MPVQRRGKSWFELSKALIDDYGPKIGAHGIAVYACLVRIGGGNDDGASFEFEDIAAMLGLEESEVADALDKLLSVGVMRHHAWTRTDGTTATGYDLVDLAPQYYGFPSALPKPEIQHIPAKPARSSPVCKGFVYVVEGEGYFKIGCTKDLYQRIKALTVKAPFDLVIHLVIPSLDIYATERELHRRFAKKHRRGEWFNLDSKDIEEIRGEYQVLDPAFLAVE